MSRKNSENVATEQLQAELNDNVVCAPKSALEVSNVTKIFNRGTVNEKIALDDVSLTLNDGDFVTIIGGNGAGKSTLLNVIAGVFDLNRGSVIIDGKDVTKTSEYKRAALVSRVFQDPMLGTASAMSIEDNLALASLRGKYRNLGWNVTKKDRERFRELVASLGLGLETRMSTKVDLLSGGQRQALTLLMATVVKPKLLLLDEHTAALDPKTAAKVLELTERVTSQNNQTTIMITHNMRDALAYGNKIVMMHEGKIIFSAEGEEKSRLSVNDLLVKFQELGDENDRILLG